MTYIPRPRLPSCGRPNWKRSKPMNYFVMIRRTRTGYSVDVPDVPGCVATGKTLAEVSRANAGLVERDMRFAKRARDVLREIPIPELMKMIKKAADLYLSAELPLGNGTQTPDDFARMQSATTGLPEHMVR